MLRIGLMNGCKPLEEYMSLYRRWLDPLRSTWWLSRPKRQAQLPIADGLRIYLRLDDVYSYLAVQQLKQLEQILVNDLKPLVIVISHQAAPPPAGMAIDTWQHYSFNDAKILALQHGFAFDDVPELPTTSAIEQAYFILERTPLQGDAFLYLLEDIFHMLWNQQYHKLNMLYLMAQHYPQPTADQQLRFTKTPVLSAYFEFGGRRYHAVDDLLRLTRRLQQQKLLTSAPIFLINHLEWREHLIHDAASLNQIQMMQPTLDLYVALEDPFTWLLLRYIADEFADLYNMRMTVYPLPYQGCDQFDWNVAMRLSKRAEVAFTPFCRPDAVAVEKMAQAFYQVTPDQQLELLLELLQGVWTQGKDLGYMPHLRPFLERYDIAIDDLTESTYVEQLKHNQQQCEMWQQPHLPVMVLRVANQQFVFNSLYRVWLIESIFSHLLSQHYVAREPSYSAHIPLDEASIKQG